MIIWYKNSILASLISIVSCLIGIEGISLVTGGEAGAGIAMIAVAVIGVFAGKFISDNKTVKDHLKEMEKEQGQTGSKTSAGSSSSYSGAASSSGASTTRSTGTGGSYSSAGSSTTRSAGAGGSSYAGTGSFSSGGSSTTRSAGAGGSASSAGGSARPAFCAYCGARLPGAGKFCPSCGKPVIGAGFTGASSGAASGGSSGAAASAGSSFGGSRTLSPEEAEKIVNDAITQASACALEEDYNTEIHILKNALSSVPDSAVLLNRIGRAYRRSGDADQAIEYYRRALAEDDSDPTIHGNLGMALIAQGKYQESRPHMERALRMAEDRPGSITQNDRAAMYANYAFCIGKLGDLTGARDNLTRAEQYGYGKDKSSRIWEILK